MTESQNLAALGWKPRKVPGLLDRIGPLWTRRENEQWGYGLLLDESHCNGAGMVHGGVVTTLADHALSAIAWEAAERLPCITIQLGTQYLAPVRPGDFLEARGMVIQRGRSLLFMEGRLSVGERDVASASGVWKRI